MAFKIYTYEDPYKLDKTDFWNEISCLPHFCSARTLVNGLKSVLEDKIQGLICPLDELIQHEEVYKAWTDNISLRVEQYSILSSAFKLLLESNKIDKCFYMALTQNQNHFLEALRLFIELNIPATSLDSKKGNAEQRLFTYMLNKVSANPKFQFPNTPNKMKLQNIISEIAVKEVDDCRGPQREIDRCKRAASITKNQELQSIVVHGVHQFNPVQLRLLLSMEKMGINIIFLFNYQKKYSNIYSSWDEIYSCFDVPFHHDSNINEYQIPTMQNPSNALACAIGELCQDRSAIGSNELKNWNKLYRDIDLLEFANITEYAHFISAHFDSAIKKYSESRSIIAQGNNVWNNVAVLRYLDEQVYTANRDVHTLLKIYYPEYAKDRHFLSYPIGQFFSAIYKLWDYENGKILFDVNAIKECLSSSILNTAPGEELLRTFYNTQILFENIKTYDEFKEKVADIYIQNYDYISKVPGSDVVASLKQLSIYNKYKVPLKDVKLLIKAIEEINEIATYLFSQDNSKEDFINFGKHFQNLEEFLKQRELSLANEQERALITALQLRLDKIKPEQSSFSGTFRDLKEGLYFYLKQKNDEDHGVDWIVKNYEQIDGDILQSKKQFEHEENKVYHFACVSDRDMNMTVNDQLPWPLTDEFIRVAYTPIDLQFQVYYTAIGERSNFLRYALFYGLCFNRCKTRLSYVKQYDDETTEPYAILSVLGFKPKAQLIESMDKSTPFTISINRENTKLITYDCYQMMDMFLCPYRYFLDYVTENNPVVQGDFLYQKYYENLLIESVWKRVGTKNRSEVLKYLSKIIDQESAKLDPYFSFWKSTELFDLKLRARNYLSYEIITDGYGTLVKPFNQIHMNMRKLFGTAKFVVDTSEIDRKNPYEKFENLTAYKGFRKEYSLHKLPKKDVQGQEKILASDLCLEAEKYINQIDSKDKTAIPSDWCLYCTHRGICLESFLVGEMSTSGNSKEHPRRDYSSNDRKVEISKNIVKSSQEEIILSENDNVAKAASGILTKDIDGLKNTYTNNSWTPEQENKLVLLYKKGVPIYVLPKIFKKSPGEVKAKLDELLESKNLKCTTESKNSSETPIQASEESNNFRHLEKSEYAQEICNEKFLEQNEDEKTKKNISQIDNSKLFNLIQSLQEMVSENTNAMKQMVSENSHEIEQLKREVSIRRYHKQDTSKIEALLASEEEKSKSLMEKLSITESKLAFTEATNRTLTNKVNKQNVLLEKEKSLDFTEDELKSLDQYSAIIIFDTCSIMNFPDLLQGVCEGELVVVPKVVNNELENHKVNHYFDERKAKAQHAITAIFNYKRMHPLIYAESLIDLVPEVYRADEGEKELNDNKILAVAIRYRKYTTIPVVFITDDRSLSNKAAGENIQVWSAEDFLDSLDDANESADIDEKQETGTSLKAKNDFLSQKICTKNLHIEQSQLSALQNNGIKTIADFLAQTEESFAAMKVKKGPSYTSRYLQIQESLKKTLNEL